MSSPTRVTGTVTITPPLSWAQIRSGPGLHDVQLVLEETHEDSDTGRTTTTTAVAVEPRITSPYNGSEIAADLTNLLTAFPDHEFAGIITAKPEDPDGLPWRYVVRSRWVERQQAQLTWPGGEAVQS